MWATRPGVTAWLRGSVGRFLDHASVDQSRSGGLLEGPPVPMGVGRPFWSDAGYLEAEMVWLKARTSRAMSEREVVERRAARGRRSKDRQPPGRQEDQPRSIADAVDPNGARLAPAPPVL